MVRLKIFLGICIVLLTLVGCVERTELSNVVVLATPKSDSTLFSYEKMRYHLRLFTINEYVDGLTISSLDLDRGKTICVDTLFESKKKELEYDFIYTAPQISKEELDVELSFMVKDNMGNTSEIKRDIKVRSLQQVLTEKNGIILYAHNAYLPNCLSLSDVSQPFVSLYADSLKADIWINPSEEQSNITWESQTGVKFVRYNDFNYATATKKSLQATYQSSKRYDAINHVAINDIIIVGREDQTEGVFFVDNIVYNETLQYECLQLSFKGIAN